MASTISLDGGKLVYTAEELINRDFNEVFYNDLEKKFCDWAKAVGYSNPPEPIENLVDAAAYFLRVMDRIGMVGNYWID